MLRIVLISAALLLLTVSSPCQQASPELERLNGLIEELTALKAQTAAVEARIDNLLRSLSEQRGAIQQKPPAYNALMHLNDAPDPKPAAVPVRRCAAITSSGSRCSRPAVENARYCKQHQLSHAK